MRFEGPTAGDMTNIRALNRAFLVAAGPAVSDRPLSPPESGLLASAPFLLFSLREQDAAYWDSVLSGGPQFDLVEVTPTGPLRRLQAAALAYVWQLARQNPYVARLVCGAPPQWCERLGERTLMELLDVAAYRADLLVPRFDADDPVMQRLLEGGTRGQRRLRRMAQHLALQTMLTERASARYRRLPAAACSIRPVPRRVGESANRRKV